MADERRPEAPRTFFLNETHEYARGEPEGGGRVPSYSQIDWGAKGRRLALSLRSARTVVESSADPLRQTRFFLLSAPETNVAKDSKAKDAKDGSKEVSVAFGGEHARVFERLDLQLLRVTEAGDALVHAKPQTLEQLEATATRLADSGRRDQARWALLREFRAAPLETRVDVSWLDQLPARVAHDVIVELQPVLTRADVDAVAQAIGARLYKEKDEQITVGGRDPSGRRWLRASMSADTIRYLAREFGSIQTIHAPLMATLFAATPTKSETKRSATPTTPLVRDLPAVAIVDAGVPREHSWLAPYRRHEYRHPDAQQVDLGDHGSRVASRVVFGDASDGDGYAPPTNPQGQCRYLDIIVPVERGNGGDLELDGKAIFESVAVAARQYPDVRVFNLSFGSYLSLARLLEPVRHERLVELQDLDNFAFDNDLIVVVAAGNSRPGVRPNIDYPGHVDDTDWALGAWAAGFNTVIVGGYVPRANTDGLARRPGWPSPFTRIGPGVAGAPVPNFAAGAGDSTGTHQWRPGIGLGVWTLNRAGLWEDAPGTSHAAPIVAREAAFLLRDLQRYCPAGVIPFASTVKAFLQLVARPLAPPPSVTPVVRKLAARTLGQGRPRADRLLSPVAETAVFLWQGTLEKPGHKARIRVPVPRQWLEEADAPKMRVICAWNAPVNAAAPDVWACRQVSVQLRPALDAPAPRGHGKSVGAYPVVDRVYDLAPDSTKNRAAALIDEWVLEAAYVDVAPYPPLMRIDEQQRVSLAIELFDESEKSVSPQSAVQAMVGAETMVSLGGMRQPIWSPIKIPT